MMPMPKMTKAHRMYLYGVLTTGIVAVLVAGLTAALFMFRDSRTSLSQDAMSVVRNSPHPDSVGLPPQPGPLNTDVAHAPPGLVTGWVKSADLRSIVLSTTRGRQTIVLTNATQIHMLNAAALNPIEAKKVKGDAIPVDALAHVILVVGSDDVAAEITVVKNHD